MAVGYIKLWRKLLDSDMYLSLNSVQRDVMVQCLLFANHEPKKWEWNGLVFSCQPGQFVTSLDSLKKACASDVTTQNIRTALSKLEKWNFLTNESTKTGRLITIINWGTYQKNESTTNKEDNKELTKSQQTANKELTPTKKLKNIKKDTEPSPVKDFIEYASSTFKEKYQAPMFINWGKDGKLVKELLGVYELNKLKEIWGAFLNSKDPFIEKAGRSIGVFQTQVNKLAQAKSTQRQVVF